MPRGRFCKRSRWKRSAVWCRLSQNACAAAAPQAGGAGPPITTPPRAARHAGGAGRGVVRDEDGGRADGEPRSPTWDLAALPRLAEPLRARGVDVRFDVDDDVAAGAIPAHVAGVAYRVVQEALTNVGRHAPAARTVRVRVGREEGTLRIVVTDDGAPAGRPAASHGGELDGGPGEAPHPGYGLRGMRERVEGAGGTLRTGPSDDSPGFVVDARIPLTPRELSDPGGRIRAREPDNSEGEGER
jgi:hypothetical protein